MVWQCFVLNLKNFKLFYFLIFPSGFSMLTSNFNHLLRVAVVQQTLFSVLLKCFQSGRKKNKSLELSVTSKKLFLYFPYLLCTFLLPLVNSFNFLLQHMFLASLAISDIVVKQPIESGTLGLCCCNEPHSA